MSDFGRIQVSPLVADSATFANPYLNVENLVDNVSADEIIQQRVEFGVFPTDFILISWPLTTFYYLILRNPNAIDIQCQYGTTLGATVLSSLRPNTVQVISDYGGGLVAFASILGFSLVDIILIGT